MRNTFIIFIVSGFWHGANLTFIVWGTLHALFIFPLMFLNQNRDKIEIVAKGKILPSLREILQIFITFLQVSVAWIFFRSENLSHAFSYLSIIFSKSLFSFPHNTGIDLSRAPIFPLILLLIVEWFGREKKYALEEIHLHFNGLLRWSFYVFIIFLIGIYARNEVTPFIYFQF